MVCCRVSWVRNRLFVLRVWYIPGEESSEETLSELAHNQVGHLLFIGPIVNVITSRA